MRGRTGDGLEEGPTWEKRIRRKSAAVKWEPVNPASVRRRESERHGWVMALPSLTRNLNGSGIHVAKPSNQKQTTENSV